MITEEDVRAIADTRSLVSIALQSQYSHSEKYRQLGDLFRQEIDASADVDNFYNHILNPETADGKFLDVWGTRVGVSRYITVDGTETVLDDEFFRFLIFYRSMANISNATSATINLMLTKLSGFKTKVFDRQDMTADVVLFGSVGSAIREIVRLYGLLNAPSGVQVNIRIIDPTVKVFGFLGSRHTPFNLGVFNPETDIEIE
jgi:hypothetical protein